MIQWVRSVIDKPKQPNMRRRLRSFRPTVEALGERCLLSGGYFQANLVSDVTGLAAYTDPNLVNPWGMAVGPTGPFWFGDNETSVSSVALSDGQPFPKNKPMVVSVPGLAGEPGGLGSPTGVVFNGVGGFKVSENGESGSSLFLFASEEGIISGWSFTVDLNHAIPVVNESASPGLGPVYTGLAIGSNSQGTFLYAANFRTGAIDVFDQSFDAVHWQNAFKDPALPAGFSPFNIQQIGASLYVTFIKNDDGRYDADNVLGNGYVDIFNTNGHLLQRLVSNGPLDEPWGLTLSPSNFGRYSNDLLVGNFGDGRINAFDPQTGAFLGTLDDAAGQAITLPGLWAIGLGNSGAPSDALYFTAGIGGEYHGLFGSLKPVTSTTGTTSGSETSLGLFESQNGNNSDDYPVPPGTGPTLLLSPGPLDQLSVSYLPLSSSSLAIVPTVSAAAGGHGSGTGVGAGSAVAAGQGTAPVVASLGTYFVAMNPPADSWDSGSNAGVRPGSREVPAWVDLFAGQLQLPGNPGALPGGQASPTIRDVAIVTETPSVPIPNSESVSVNDARPDIYHAIRHDDQTAIAKASIGPVMESSHENGGWLLQTSQWLLAALLAGCALHLFKIKRRLLDVTTFAGIKSFLSRFSRHSPSTVLATSGQAPYGEELPTRITDVEPQSWEKSHAAPKPVRLARGSANINNR